MFKKAVVIFALLAVCVIAALALGACQSPNAEVVALQTQVAELRGTQTATPNATQAFQTAVDEAVEATVGASLTPMGPTQWWQSDDQATTTPSYEEFATQVQSTMAVLNGDATAAPTAAGTNIPAGRSGDGEMESDGAETPLPTQSYADGSVTVSGFPAQSYPVRWGNGEVQQNTNPVDSAAWIIAEPGVLSADDIADCGTNLSCVWSGGASVDNVLENSTGTILCPEGGYVKVTLPQAIISAGDFTITLNDVSGTSYTVVARCPYAEGEGDNSLPVEFQTEHPGRVKVMRYPVPFEHGGFFSFEHLEEDLANSAGTSAEHDLDGADNCGNNGCERNLLVLADYNHGTLGIYDYQGPSNWLQLFSNAVKPSLAPTPTPTAIQ